MRVIAGIAKGRKLKAVPGEGTRPILDRVKTALFDGLRAKLPGRSFLDLFGGSGAVGIEALSQGAAHCTFIDAASQAVRTIRANLETTGLTAQATVVQQDALRFLKEARAPFDLIYIAPPQYKELWKTALLLVDARKDLLKSDGQAIVQIDPREYEEIPLESLVEERQRKYGNTLLIFYSLRPV